MIAIIDYGVGNIFSLKSSFSCIGAQAELTSDKEKIMNADKLILPGVGAFADAADKLEKSGLAPVIVREAERGKPLLGICLGMQLLLEKSYEYGEHKGLGLIPGCVVPIKPEVPQNFKIPHIGWNALSFPEEREKSKLYKYTREGEFVYFVHSFYAKAEKEAISATCEYSARLTASVEYKNVYGTQFHPEKSGKAGLDILRAFCEI